MASAREGRKSIDRAAMRALAFRDMHHRRSAARAAGPGHPPPPDLRRADPAARR